MGVLLLTGDDGTELAVAAFKLVRVVTTYCCPVTGDYLKMERLPDLPVCVDWTSHRTLAH